ncbi:MAG: ABC transporter permease, partial [Candidatus Methylomirabilales bacterium]
MNMRLLGIMRKEFIQLWRDRITLTLILFMPAMMLWIFGIAVNTEVKHISTVVWDQARTPESRQLLEALENSQYFAITDYAKNLRQVTESVDRGGAKVGVVIPPDFSENLHARRPAQVQVIVDATDPLVATSAVNAATAIGQARSLDLAVEAFQGMGIRAGSSPLLDVRVRAWYNPDMLSPLFIIPGLIGAMLMQTTIAIVAAVIVREKERGTLEALIVSPLRRWELMTGKLVPNIVVAYAQMTVALVLGHLFFHVPIRGNLVLLYAMSLVFIIGSLGLGIYISTLAQTQHQAMQISYFFFLPGIYLSGLLFPVEGMPPVGQVLAHFMPLTYYLQILRGILLKGIGIAYLWPQLLILSAFGVVV